LSLCDAQDEDSKEGFVKISYTFLGLALYLQGAACYAGQYNRVQPPGSSPTAPLASLSGHGSQTTTSTPQANQPYTQALGSIDDPKTVATYWQWDNGGNNLDVAPAGFQGQFDLALTGSITAHAQGNDASSHGYMYAYLTGTVPYYGPHMDASVASNGAKPDPKDFVDSATTARTQSVTTNTLYPADPSGTIQVDVGINGFSELSSGASYGSSATTIGDQTTVVGLVLNAAQ